MTLKIFDTTFDILPEGRIRIAFLLFSDCMPLLQQSPMKTIGSLTPGNEVKNQHWTHSSCVVLFSKFKKKMIYLQAQFSDF